MHIAIYTAVRCRKQLRNPASMSPCRPSSHGVYAIESPSPHMCRATNDLAYRTLPGTGGQVILVCAECPGREGHWLLSRSAAYDVPSEFCRLDKSDPVWPTWCIRRMKGEERTHGASHSC